MLRLTSPAFEDGQGLLKSLERGRRTSHRRCSGTACRTGRDPSRSRWSTSIPSPEATCIGWLPT